MSKERTHSGILGEWQRLVDSLSANEGQLGHLMVFGAALEALRAEAREIATEQAAMIAAKQEASKRLKTVLTEGQRLSTVLRLALKQHYGISSEKLAEFGLQPFRGRPRTLPPPAVATADTAPRPE